MTMGYQFHAIPESYGDAEIIGSNAWRYANFSGSGTSLQRLGGVRMKR
jgi:hypothetical protein